MVRVSAGAGADGSGLLVFVEASPPVQVQSPAPAHTPMAAGTQMGTGETASEMESQCFGGSHRPAEAQHPVYLKGGLVRRMPPVPPRQPCHPPGSGPAHNGPAVACS